MNEERFENMEEENFQYFDNYQSAERKPKSNRWIPLYLAIAFLTGIMVALYLIPSQQSGLTNNQVKKFNEVLHYIDLYYVDTVNDNQLIEAAINGMLQNLDPHSTYANAVEHKAMQESLDGAFEGIGVQFNIFEDTVMVAGVVTGGPSEKAGIRVGDRIVTVDGKNFAGIGIKNDDVMKTLRGKKGSIVNIGIKRDGFSQIYHYEVIRNVIPTYTVDVSYMIDDHDGYIKINQFGSTTANEFAKALVKLKGQGMTKLILDLRGNPGGYLDAAVSVCDELLPAGELIVYTEGLNVKSDRIYATRYGHFETGELVVLIDDFSASASEIVAGAVQDNDRGMVVGRRSFGKGLVQRQFDLEDKSTIRLTVSRYHTPSGRSIQKNYNQGHEAYAEELMQRYKSGEMDSASNIKFDESVIYKTKNGRTVYGHGGIMPDYFVPLDRDSNLTAFYQVLNSSTLYEYAFNYAAIHQDNLKKRYPDAKSYVKNMRVDENMYQELLQYYYKKQKKGTLHLNDASRRELKIWLKAYVGRNLYQEEAFYPLINQTDKVIIKAIEL